MTGLDPVWLNALASANPEPSGGAAAAVTVAMAAGLTEMAAGASNESEEITGVLTHAAYARLIAVELVSIDGAASSALATALRRLVRSDVEREARIAALTDAVLAASGAAASLADLAVGLLPELQILVELGNPAVMADIGVAAALLAAALRACIINVQANAELVSVEGLLDVDTAVGSWTDAETRAHALARRCG